MTTTTTPKLPETTFICEALAADAKIDAGATVYRARDVHDWLDRLAKNGKAARPKPWRK